MPALHFILSTEVNLFFKSWKIILLPTSMGQLGFGHFILVLETQEVFYICPEYESPLRVIGPTVHSPCSEAPHQ